MVLRARIIQADGIQGRLRKRLAMALSWFQVLDNRAEVLVNETVSSKWHDDRSGRLWLRNLPCFLSAGIGFLMAQQ